MQITCTLFVLGFLFYSIHAEIPTSNGTFATAAVPVNSSIVSATAKATSTVSISTAHSALSTIAPSTNYTSISPANDITTTAIHTTASPATNILSTPSTTHTATPPSDTTASPVSQTSTDNATITSPSITNHDATSAFNTSTSPVINLTSPSATTPAIPNNNTQATSPASRGTPDTSSLSPSASTVGRTSTQKDHTSQSPSETTSQVLSTAKETSTVFKPSEHSARTIITTRYPITTTRPPRTVEAMLCKKLKEEMNITKGARCLLSFSPDDNVTSMKFTYEVDTDRANKYYQEIKNMSKHHEENDRGGLPKVVIAVLASGGALIAIIIGIAVAVYCHRRSHRKNQQHLTEELQTVENGYHDNPTLEVMEVQSEMQEKKLALNGEFNDSWIVPIDNLVKDDMPDEEDTHL
ncbi:podocalyxin isoform X2 [Chanos chanos]|uniref:Podocalyxin n=1 Tax=Chanos chanos TaxID=29144 RepID=A0A6J2WC60_CHACN|nr:podocalyxin isoform X2 [Chanos chanos]